MDEALEADADGILLAPANSNSLVESCEKAREDSDFRNGLLFMSK